MNIRLQTRRSALVATLSAVGATASLLACAHAEPPLASPPKTRPTGHEHDWDWLVGRWNVKHRRLKERLTGCTQWEEFAGTSVVWLTLGGLGNVDNNVIEIPSGTYHGLSLRAFDAKSNQWAIWWLDARDPTVIEPPVRGGFKDGVGTFMGDDTLRGKPIKVRFLWSKITPTSAHWEQAFSPDGGATWEMNWENDFTRTG